MFIVGQINLILFIEIENMNLLWHYDYTSLSLMSESTIFHIRTFSQSSWVEPCSTK